MIRPYQEVCEGVKWLQNLQHAKEKEVKNDSTE
jgi:hypothetical protein